MSDTTKTQMTAAEAMLARHSVRQYQPGLTIPTEDLNEILELAASAPSSWNLQHWRYLVVTDQARKESLLPLAYNQQQVVDSSAVIILLGDLEADKAAEVIYGKAVEAGMSPEVRDTLVGQVKGAYQNKQFAHDEAVLNASLSAMQLMLAAKAKGYDTCPMGGFSRDAVRKELNIPERYYPVMMLTLGTAAAQAHGSGRLSLDELVIKETF